MAIIAEEFDFVVGVDTHARTHTFTAVHTATGAVPDAKDAAVIADQARMRTDLRPLRAGDAINTGLRLLTARRADRSADRVRANNRLQA